MEYQKSDFIYYALHQYFDPNETLQQVIIGDFGFRPDTGFVLSDGSHTAPLAENPYITIAVKYAGDSTYSTLKDNVPTLAADQAKFTYISRAQLIAAGLDPNKTVEEMYFYFHKNGQGELPADIDDLSTDKVFFYKEGQEIPNADAVYKTNPGVLPAGSWAPFGLNGTIYFDFTPNEGFTGTLTNRVLPQAAASGETSQFNYQEWSDMSAQTETETGYFTPVKAEVASRGTETTRVVSTSTTLLDVADATHVDAGTYSLQVGLDLSDNSLANLVPEDGTSFTTYTILPVGVTLNKDDAGSNDSRQITTIDNYKGTGQQVVKAVWDWLPYLRANDNRVTTFRVDVANNAAKNLTFLSYADLGSETKNNKYTIPDVSGTADITATQEVADGSSLGFGTDNPLIYAGNRYVLHKDALVQTNQTVQGKNGAAANSTTVQIGDQATVHLNITPNSDSTISQLDLLDTLPTRGDTGLTTDQARESTFTPTLAGPITLPSNWQGKVQVLYTTDAVNKANPDAAHWVEESGVSDWAQIKAFRVLLDPSTGKVINGQNQVISFVLNTPANEGDYAGALSDQVAYNSYSLTSNMLQATEPLRVAIKVQNQSTTSQTTPPTGGTTTTTPPTGGTTTPPTGGTATPPTGGATTPPSGKTTTPPTTIQTKTPPTTATPLTTNPAGASAPTIDQTVEKTTGTAEDNTTQNPKTGASTSSVPAAAGLLATLGAAVAVFRRRKRH